MHSVTQPCRKVTIDGYLRSGNINVETDALGNAAALDVYKFLTLVMEDGRKLIDHIQEDSELAVSLLDVQPEAYQMLKDGFLSMIKPNKEAITSSKIKQVYFPVLDSYHQLSLLTPSGILYELKKRVDNLRFSEEVKTSREQRRNNNYSETGFSDLYGITTIAYGGTKPQNISVFNNQNGGKAHLLLSMPPQLKRRDIRFPKHDFFHESLHFYEYREVFDSLNKLFKIDYNNIHIREGRDNHLQDLVDRIVDKMWSVRAVCQEQYRPEYSQLKPHQKIWLCDEYQQSRQDEDEWLDKLCHEISRWIITTYEKFWGKHTSKLGEAERLHIHNIANKDREALR